MLWDFNSDKAVQYFNSWTTLMKLTWDCPRATRTYLVKQVLACGHISAKTEVMARFTKFFQGLRSSPSREVATLANLLARDIRSSTGRNLSTISELTGKSPWTDTADSVRIKLAEAEAVRVADMDKSRIGYLGVLLEQRQQWHYMGQEDQEKEVQTLLESLCIN